VRSPARKVATLQRPPIFDQPNVWQLEFEESVELNTLKAARNAAHILQTGFTSIGDGGCRGYIGPAIRDGVAKGVIPGPHIVAAGPILTGSAGLLDSMPVWIRMESDQALGMTVNGVDEVRSAQSSRRERRPISSARS